MSMLTPFVALRISKLYSITTKPFGVTVTTAACIGKNCLADSEWTVGFTCLHMTKKNQSITDEI